MSLADDMEVVARAVEAGFVDDLLRRHALEDVWGETWPALDAAFSRLLGKTFEPYRFASRETYRPIYRAVDARYGKVSAWGT